jgi:hypothetical protein
MTFLDATLKFLSWLLTAVRRLLQVDRTSALKSLLALNASLIINVLVFFLPLKVVLLVASTGVPRYFRFFVSEQTRGIWIVSLTILIFVLYAFSRVLDSRTRRWTATGAASLAATSERVPIATNEVKTTELYFREICHATARVTFLALALLLGLVLYPALFTILTAILLAEFMFASKAAGNLNAVPNARLSLWVRENSRDFINLLKSLNFLIVFAFLVTVFLIGRGPNLLIAIASIMLSRQMFNAASNIVKDAQKLESNRARIDTLLFTNVQLKNGQEPDYREFRHRYDVASRMDRPRCFSHHDQGQIQGVSEELDDITQSIWVDSGIQEVAVFDLYLSNPFQPNRPDMRELVYAGKAIKGVDRQDYLLRSLDPAQFNAIPLLGQYEEKPFVARIFDIRGLTDVTPKWFKSQRNRLITDLAAVELPFKLTQAHLRAHQPLSERINGTVLNPLDLAADEVWAREAYLNLMEQLDPLLERVRQLPFVLVNPRLNPRNAMADAQGNLRLLDWRTWTLEPAGAGFDPQEDPFDLLVEIAEAVRSRPENPGDLSLADVLCGSLLLRMEALVQKAQPKAALRLAHDTVPLLGLGDRELVAAQNRFIQDRSTDLVRRDEALSNEPPRDIPASRKDGNGF